MYSRMRPGWIVSLLIAVLLAGCAPGAKPASEQQTAVMAPEVKAYLDELMELMQKNSINRLTIDWDEFRAKVFARAAGAKSIEETRPAIGEALMLLGDNHSLYQPNGGSMISAGTKNCSTRPVKTPEVPSTVGYVAVSGFSGSDPAASTAFVKWIQEAVKSAHDKGATGYLVDLRRNTGGNMWPMLVGLSPILGEGPLGYFVDATGVRKLWEIRDGDLYYDGHAFTLVDKNYRIPGPAPRVAVLTDEMTVSSGEAVTIAFKGRPDTRSFGTPTCGLSTGNMGFPLSDGATLYLTVAMMADRTATSYGDRVAPDEVIDDSDRVVERALEWLRTGN